MDEWVRRELTVAVAGGKASLALPHHQIRPTDEEIKIEGVDSGVMIELLHTEAEIKLIVDCRNSTQVVIKRNVECLHSLTDKEMEHIAAYHDRGSEWGWYSLSDLGKWPFKHTPRT